MASKTPTDLRDTAKIAYTHVRKDNDGGHTQGDAWTAYGVYQPPPKPLKPGKN